MSSTLFFDNILTVLSTTHPAILVASAAVALTAAFTLLRPKTSSPNNSTLNTTKFPRNTVILHHAGPDKKHALPSASLFVVKLESYLRITQTPYQTNFTLSSSERPKGKMPFISYNSLVMGDSSLIISHLTSESITALPNPDLPLTPSQKALGTAIKALVEDKLYWIQVRLRWGEGFHDYIYPTFFRPIPFPINYIVSRQMRSGTLAMLNAQGTGRHTIPELFEFWKTDIEALSVLLGSNAYVLGDQPSSFDCVVFGFLYNVIAVKELAPEFRRVVMEKKNLVDYTDRFLRSWWPELVDKVEKDGLLLP
ncbi:hypothetical protein HDV00_002934 [Rhizophlyctis rosea]|nr:hypothetical protein HDV00_002934 [Rhizophlyctis rosea]